MSAANTEAVAKPGKKILSAGHNSTLLRSRNAIIQLAGYQVVTTKESDLLLHLAQEQHFDAVVICNSIPLHLRIKSARDLKRLKPSLPLLVICVLAEEDTFQGLANAIVVARQEYRNPSLKRFQL